ncbi:exo-alpha-sialidase [Salmonella enterica]|uniref:exo-alpha-sialidase n=1 Tax=Salmonella enterica TaxID=28901 RepID=UPI000AB1F146|nr:exo-alpha-sialidase [Salmonella enterica]
MKINKLILFGFFITPYSDASTTMGKLPVNDGWHSPQQIFSQHQKTSTNAYRIPAITATTQGTVIAVSDARADGTSDIGLNKDVHFGYRISTDGGNTWSHEQEIIPDIKGKHQISDPAIVHNTDTGSTFLFGFYNDRFITAKPVSNNSDFFMFKSDDGGKTWGKGVSLYNLAPPGYKYILQGPGSGMYYKGTVYIAAQAWHNDKDNINGGTTATSGFIYSTDNGKTWSSAWLRPDSQINGKPGTDGLPDITSESSIFHHDGYIYLSAKPETRREVENRIVYRTNNNGETWERVKEDFLPDNVSRAETSSLSLDDNVYLVGYTTQTKRAGRDGVWITTNTGRRIQVFDAPVNGYTSLAQDENNLYILFEGQGDMYFQRYDISSRDYANLNAVILNRSDDLFYIQDKLRGNTSYIKGSYGKNDSSGAELFYTSDRVKFGIFHSKQTNNSKHVYGTVNYSNDDTSFLLSKDHVVFPGDNIFVGYQNSDIDYVNKSHNDVSSWLAGYSLSHDFDWLTYGIKLNGIYSRNDFSRNHYEGLGRTATFDSYSLAIKNQLSREFHFTGNVKTNIESGLNTTYFNHSGFTEKGGNGWNNVTLDNSGNWSNQIYANAEISKMFDIYRKTELTLTASVMYQYELMNSDSWAENYTVLDSHRVMPPPVKKHRGGLTTGFLNAALNINRQTDIVAGVSLNTDGDNMVGGAITYSF